MKQIISILSFALISNMAIYGMGEELPNLYSIASAAAPQQADERRSCIEIFLAAANGNDESMKKIIQNIIDLAQATRQDAMVEIKTIVNQRNVVGATPLHYAAATGNDATIALLCSYGADLNAKDTNGYTPENYAAFHSQTENLLCLQSIKRAQQQEQGISQVQAEEAPREEFSSSKSGLSKIFHIFKKKQ